MIERTKDQAAFDMAIHGWSFSNAASLAARIRDGEEIARRLKETDPRHDTLRTMRNELVSIQQGGK